MLHANDSHTGFILQKSSGHSLIQQDRVAFHQPTSLIRIPSDRIKYSKRSLGSPKIAAKWKKSGWRSYDMTREICISSIGCTFRFYSDLFPIASFNLISPFRCCIGFWWVCCRVVGVWVDGGRRGGLLESGGGWKVDVGWWSFWRVKASHAAIFGDPINNKMYKNKTHTQKTRLTHKCSFLR